MLWRLLVIQRNFTYMELKMLKVLLNDMRRKDEALFTGKDERTMCFDDFTVFGKNIVKNYPLLDPDIKSSKERMRRHATWFKDR